jgi:hypothetical protein
VVQTEWFHCSDSAARPTTTPSPPVPPGGSLWIRPNAIQQER